MTAPAHMAYVCWVYKVVGDEVIADIVHRRHGSYRESVALEIIPKIAIELKSAARRS